MGLLQDDHLEHDELFRVQFATLDACQQTRECLQEPVPNGSGWDIVGL
jgi:hypothetical protein